MSKKGLIIVISAPSGAGKSTICNRLITAIDRAYLSLSYTTREPRKGERDGNEYFFVTQKKFNQMISQKKFLEWAKVHSHYYGTPKQNIIKAVNNGRDVVLDIDVQGGVSVKKHFTKAVLVYIMAPTMKLLEKRLRDRDQDTNKTIRMRLKNAKDELKFISKYDYVVINDRLPDAVKEILNILFVERKRTCNSSIPRF